MKNNKLHIEIWQSDLGNEEYQHFLNDKYGTYLFGMNKKLLGEKIYNQVLKMVKEKLKI